MNKVLIIGHLGRDPELHMTAGGTQVSNFSVATNHIRPANGSPEKVTEWHRIVAYGKLAEQCNGYLHKGQLVCVEGSIHTRSWEKAAGQKQSATEIVASRVTFLSPKQGGTDPVDSAEGAQEADF